MRHSNSICGYKLTNLYMTLVLEHEFLALTPPYWNIVDCWVDLRLLIPRTCDIWTRQCHPSEQIHEKKWPPVSVYASRRREWLFYLKTVFIHFCLLISNNRAVVRFPGNYLCFPMFFATLVICTRLPTRRIALMISMGSRWGLNVHSVVIEVVDHK